MNYKSWNDLISGFFFNEEMYEKEVMLYITKEDIINIGKKELFQFRDEDIWNDFIRALKDGYHGKVDDTNLLETLLLLFAHYQNESKVNPDQYFYPLYVAYLCVTILPLTEETYSNFSSNNYYNKVNTFLGKYNLPLLPNQISENNWNIIWEDLERWSIVEKNMELGFFELHKFGNPKWKFVSKPFSQCLIKMATLKKLPALFYQNNILPNQVLKDEKIENFLNNYYRQLDLKISLIKAVNERNEIGTLLIKIVKRYYDKWNGEEDTYSMREINSGVKKPWILAPLKLGLCINFVNETVDPFFRLFSHIEYPDELIFNNSIKVVYEINNWSKKITIPDAEILTGEEKYTLEDQFNRWKAIYEFKDLIILKNGSYYSLNDWIEASSLSPSEEVLVLCSDYGLSKLKKYLNEEIAGYLQPLDFIGIDKFHLYKSLKSLPEPVLNHFGINTVEEFDFLIKNSIQLNKHDYLIDIKPTISLPSIKEWQSIYLRNTTTGEKYQLSQTANNSYNFNLPKSIKRDINFEFIIENTGVNKIADIRFINPFANTYFDKEKPFRNSWAEISETENENLWKGNEYQKQLQENLLYEQSKHHFMPELNKSTNSFFKLDLQSRICYNNQKDIMLSFLSSSGKLSFSNYFKVFEQIISTHNHADKFTNINYMKYQSIRYLEYLGHIDVDYNNQKIFINKSQVILIPNRKFVGRQAILIGARFPGLVEDLIKICHDIRIKIDIENSTFAGSGLDFIIPQVIRLSVQGEQNDSYGERKIKKLCDELKILFHHSKLLQPLFLITSSKMEDYENRLIEEDGRDYEWARFIFDPENLHFKIGSGDFNRDLCLLKYYFTNYNIRYKLWLDGKCYCDNNNLNKGVEPDWGRYFILFKLKKDILLYDDNSDSLAVPVSVPLPRFFNKALVMMSGYIPERKKICGITYDIYTNLIPTLTQNIFSQLGQHIKKFNLIGV